MIQAGVREMLDRDDAQLVLRLIAQGSQVEYERAENTLRDQGINALLDDPRLFSALIRSGLGMRTSLPLFAYVVVRSALRREGENDAALADYLAALLLHFGLRDRSGRISELDDQTYTAVADIVAELDDPSVARSFFVRIHLGNYALWLSGLFPDYIERRRLRRGGPDLDYYEEMGRKGFTLAANHQLAAEHNLERVFAAAAERFLVLRIALNRISDSLLFPNVSTPERLMRQVRDEFRWRNSA